VLVQDLMSACTLLLIISCSHLFAWGVAYNFSQSPLHFAVCLTKPAYFVLSDVYEMRIIGAGVRCLPTCLVWTA